MTKTTSNNLGSPTFKGVMEIREIAPVIEGFVGGADVTKSLKLTFKAMNDKEIYYGVEDLDLSKFSIGFGSKLTDIELQKILFLPNGEARFPNLKRLNLSNYRNLTDKALRHLSGLAKLKSLDLSHCYKITGEGLQHLSRLENLNLSGCGITDEGLQHLSGLFGLQNLNLSSCHKITGEGLQHLSGLVILQDLNLSGCYRLTNEGLQHLPGLVGLQKLNLSTLVNLTNEGLQHLSGLVGLQSLDLSWSKNLTNEGLQHLSGLVGLQNLDLSDTSIGNEQVKAFLDTLTNKHNEMEEKEPSANIQRPSAVAAGKEVEGSAKAL
ncbi:MAG: hypothetical protein K0R25_481 [Rickettsiaceae bacterium]|nr:hypothetical protein [Rickettsiaceae bacterium]